MIYKVIIWLLKVSTAREKKLLVLKILREDEALDERTATAIMDIVVRAKDNSISAYIVKG